MRPARALIAQYGDQDARAGDACKTRSVSIYDRCRAVYISRSERKSPAQEGPEIKAHVLAYSEKGLISKFAIPQKILFVEALAKTSVGKIEMKALRAQ